MITRSQIKEEKTGNEKPNVPQLNEDILGIILKYAVQKEQEYIFVNYAMLDEFSDWEFDHSDPCSRPSVQEIEWPDYLGSNSRRLIHHTNVKLFSNCTLTFPNKIQKEFKTKRDLDILWSTLKHFGAIRFWNGPEGGLRLEGPGETGVNFFRKLWQKIKGPKNRKIQAPKKAKISGSELVKSLEERLT